MRIGSCLRATPGRRALRVWMAAALVAAAGCAVNPATGERQLSFMSQAQEIEMGKEADPEIVASMGLYPDDALQSYVQQLGASLAARSERPDLPWTFRVLDDPVVNAFALPGGFIYVTRGILAYMESEAELAGVLGHEIGHVTARHSVNQISRAQLTQGLWGLGTILAPELQQFEGLASASMQLAFLKFSRDDERQADELGVRYMSRLGYDPTQLSGVMAMLGQVSASQGGESAPEWLSTHPNPENREEDILEKARAANVEAQPPIIRKDQYLVHLDGLVFGEDPREGFFRGAWFYHPDMAFQLAFPDGWKTANTKQAVQGISAQEDAIIVLTLAEGSSPGDALRAFLATDGMSSGPVSDASVHGIPVVAADFQYTSQDGTLAGRVEFLSYGGSLLRIMGYSPASIWASRRGAVTGSLGSFQRLTDPDLLEVEPERLNIVTVQTSTDLASLAARVGVPERIDQIELLNRLQGGATLSTGQILKIPVGGRLPGGL